MKFLVVNQKALRDWNNVDDKPGERIGTTYTVVRHKKRGPMLLDVKVESDWDSVSKDAIEKSVADCSAVWADFIDFEEDYYLRDGKPVFFGVATAVRLVAADNDLIDL